MDQARLRISEIHVMTPGQAEAALQAVYCPRQRKTKTVAECRQCPDCQSILPDASGNDAFLVCGPKKGAPADLPIVPDGPKDLETPAWAEPSHPALALRGDTAAVRDFMSTKVYCVTPEAGVQEAVELMIRHGVSGLPVVDPQRRPLALVTKTDVLQHVELDVIVAYLAGELQPKPDDVRRVKDVMNSKVFTIGDAAPISQAAALLAQEKVHRVPVVAADETIVGVLSSMDIVRAVASFGGYEVPRAQ